MENFTKDFRYTLAMISIVIMLIYTIFFHSYDTIDCVYNNCTLYKRIGIFGFKMKGQTFSRKGIESYDFETQSHRPGKSTHTDYYPILKMKNSEPIYIPFSFCSKHSAEEFVKNLMTTNRLKKNEHPFGW